LYPVLVRLQCTKDNLLPTWPTYSLHILRKYFII